MLKTILTSLLAGLLTVPLTAGCRTHLPPTPQYTCPPVRLGPNNTAGNYKTLNIFAPASETTYTDLNSAKNSIVPGTWCYVAQTLLNGRASRPSNTTMVTVAPGKHKVVLSWMAPPNCKGCTYILSRTAAIAAHPKAPTLDNSRAAKEGNAPAAERNAPAALVK